MDQDKIEFRDIRLQIAVVEGERRRIPTQEEFAKMLSLPVANIRNWEIGRRYPRGPARTLLVLAATKPVELFDLCGYKVEMRQTVAA